MQQAGARACLEARNAGVRLDVDDCIDGKQNVVPGSEFHDEIPDPAFRRIDEHTVNGAY